MDSTLATRLWRICKESNRPFPKVSDDDVTDYMVMEAVAIKAAHEDEKAQKEAEEKRKRDEFKKGKPGDGLPDGVER